MSCNNPDHAALEKELEASLDDILRLEEELADCQRSALQGGVATASEVAALIRENDSLGKERDRYRDEALSQKSKLQDFEVQFEEKDHRLKELDTQCHRLEEDLENTRKILRTEKVYAAEASKQLNSIESQGRHEQRDHIKILSELQELREKNAELSTRLEDRESTIAEIEMVGKQLIEQNALITARCEDQESQMREIQDELNQTRDKLAEALDQVKFGLEAEDEFQRLLDGERENAQSRIEELESELVLERHTKEVTRSELPQSQGILLDHDALNPDEEIKQLTKLLKAKERELNEANSTLMGIILQSPSFSLNSRIDILTQKLNSQAQALIDEGLRYKELEAQKSFVESELLEAESWKATYEAGHGMEAMAQQLNTLKRDVMRAEKEREERALVFGDVLDDRDQLRAMCQLLKKELGKPDDFFYPDIGKIRSFQSEEVTRLNALVVELQQKIDSSRKGYLQLLQKMHSKAVSGRESPILIEEDESGLHKESELWRTNSNTEGSSLLGHTFKSSKEDPLNSQTQTFEFKSSSSKALPKKLVVRDEMSESDYLNKVITLNDTATLLKELAKLQQAVADQKKAEVHCEAGLDRSEGDLKRGKQGVNSGTQTEYIPASQLMSFALPPEEWAIEVRDLNAQLAEALEKLSERESELNEHDEMIGLYEKNLCEMRAQISILYRDHGVAVEAAKKEAREAKSLASNMEVERDNLAVKCRNLEVIGDADTSESTTLLRNLTRKVIAYEVNEQELSRRYLSMEEQLKLAKKGEMTAEEDFNELEATTKKRILVLEQYRAFASEQLLKLAHELERSVPIWHLENAQTALSSLREDFLRLLEQEAYAQVKVAEMSKALNESSALKVKFAALEEELIAANTAKCEAEKSMEYSKNLSLEAVQVAQTQLKALQRGAIMADLSDIMREAFGVRQDAAKAEVEKVYAIKRLENALARVDQLENERGALSSKCELLALSEKEAREAYIRERDARASLLEVYGGGLTGPEASNLRQKCISLEGEREGLIREHERYKEVADIASRQAQALSERHRDNSEEITELRKHISDLEARSDDDLTIGRLQRNLMTLRAAHRSLVRKHELTRSNLRRKTAMVCLLEADIKDREEKFGLYSEKSREQIATLRGALMKLSNLDINLDVDSNSNLNVIRGKALSNKIESMSKILAENIEKMALSEAARLKSEMDASVLSQSLISAERALNDLQSCISNDGDVLQDQVLSKIKIISSDLKQSRISEFQSNLALESLRREYRNLEIMVVSKDKELKRLEKIALRVGLAEIEGDFAADLLVEKLDFMTEVVENSDHILTEKDRDFLLHQALSFQAFDIDEIDLEKARVCLKSNASHINALKKLLSESNALQKQLENRAITAENRVNSLLREISFYESQAREADLPCSKPNSRAASALQRDYHGAQLQEAAAATIASLKKLLEEKNASIERYQLKLQQVREEKIKESGIDRTEVDRIASKLYTDNADAIDQLRYAIKQLAGNKRGPFAGESGVLSTKLMDRLEEVAEILAEKDRLCQELEAKLNIISNQNRCAEERCSESLAEMQRMQADMVKLVDQLNIAEQKKSDLVEDAIRMESDLARLRSELLDRESVTGDLREALVQLKMELVSMEEEKDGMEAKYKQLEDLAILKQKKAVNQAIVEKNKQLESIKSKLDQANAEMQKLKVLMEKAISVRNKTGIENKRLHAEIEQLKEKIRNEDMNKRPKYNDNNLNLNCNEAKIEELEAKIETLAAKNKELRSASAALMIPLTNAANRDQNVLESHALELKQHSETERILRGRIATLEKRLEAKINLEPKLPKHAPVSFRGLNETQKRVNDKDVNLGVREEMEARVFVLEEENAVLKRKVMIEMPAQVEVLQYEIKCLKEELEECENCLEKEKELIEAIQSSENDEDLVEFDIVLYKECEEFRVRVKETEQRCNDLGKELLERDARIIELTYDQKEYNTELMRLRRRCEELEKMLGSKKLTNNAAKSSRKVDDDKNQELQIVIDSMKRIIEKQTQEIDRHRRASADSKKISDSEKKRQILRKQNEELMEEINTLRERVTVANSSSLQLVQQQDLIQNLRKQMLSRDSTTEQLRGELMEAKTSLSLVSEADKMSPHLAALTEEIEELKGEVDRLQGLLCIRNSEKSSLSEENARLKRELQAFDLDFFDDLEDLKYKYQEAMRRLRTYEGSDSL